MHAATTAPPGRFSFTPIPAAPLDLWFYFRLARIPMFWRSAWGEAAIPG